MNFRLFGCGKFRFLAIEKFDRDLTPREADFYRKHKEVCYECLRYEQTGTNAMNLLSSAAMEPEISENFDQRVLNLWRKQKKVIAFQYWSPLLAGAAVAGLALIATLQLISRTPVHPFQSGTTVPSAYNDDQTATTRNLVLPQYLSIRNKS